MFATLLSSYLESAAEISINLRLNSDDLKFSALFMAHKSSSNNTTSHIAIKNVDKRTLFTVSGFIRKCQKLLPHDNVYYNIPSLVEHICISFYWIAEYFTIHTENILLTDNKNTAKTVGNSVTTVYGNIKVSDPSIIYKWTFKAEQGLGIGIDSSIKSTPENDFSNPNIKNTVS